MDASKLTAYRESAAAAKERASIVITGNSHISHVLRTDIPTLATAVAELCAEVERLNRIVDDLKDELDSHHESHYRGDA